MKRLGALALLTVLSAGCASTRAQTPVDRPVLEVPPAPPRVIDPPPSPEVSQPAPVEDLPSAPAPTPATRSRPRETAKPETQKPEAKTEAPPADPAPATPPQPTGPQQPTTPVPTLRTPATADTAAAERRIREVLARAQNGLSGIDYQRLSVQRKGAYDQAKDFIDGAEAAVKASNFELAMEMADKADKLVRELSGR